MQFKPPLARLPATGRKTSRGPTTAVGAAAAVPRRRAPGKAGGHQPRRVALDVPVDVLGVAPRRVNEHHARAQRDAQTQQDPQPSHLGAGGMGEGPRAA